jgi:hypothetical protein
MLEAVKLCDKLSVPARVQLAAANAFKVTVNCNILPSWANWTATTSTPTIAKLAIYKWKCLGGGGGASEFIHRQTLRENKLNLRCSVSSAPANSALNTFRLYHVYVIWWTVLHCGEEVIVVTFNLRVGRKRNLEQHFCFKCLQTKRNLLYIRKQPVPRCKHFPTRL